MALSPDQVRVIAISYTTNGATPRRLAEVVCEEVAYDVGVQRDLPEVPSEFRSEAGAKAGAEQAIIQGRPRYAVFECATVSPFGRPKTLIDPAGVISMSYDFAEHPGMAPNLRRSGVDMGRLGIDICFWANRPLLAADTPMRMAILAIGLAQRHDSSGSPWIILHEDVAGDRSIDPSRELAHSRLMQPVGKSMTGWLPGTGVESNPYQLHVANGVEVPLVETRNGMFEIKNWRSVIGEA